MFRVQEQTEISSLSFGKVLAKLVSRLKKDSYALTLRIKITLNNNLFEIQNIVTEKDTSIK